MKATRKQQKNTSIYSRYNSVWDSLQYGGEPLLVGFTDSNWAGDPNDRKSIAGYVFSLGSGPITWVCKKQQALSLSLAEAEY